MKVTQFGSTSPMERNGTPTSPVVWLNAQPICGFSYLISSEDEASA
jgi:hypothetical protein